MMPFSLRLGMSGINSYAERVTPLIGYNADYLCTVSLKSAAGAFGFGLGGDVGQSYKNHRVSRLAQ